MVKYSLQGPTQQDITVKVRAQARDGMKAVGNWGFWERTCMGNIA